MSFKRVVKKIVPPTTSMVDARRDAILRGQQRVIEEIANSFSEATESLRSEITNLQHEIRMVHAEMVGHEAADRSASANSRKRHDEIIVSMASYAPRLAKLAPTLQSLAEQTRHPDRLLVWIPRKDAPKGYLSFSAEVLHAISESGAEIRWVDTDLGPHNKYYHAMREYPEATIITVDDDGIYDRRLVEVLVDASSRFPGSIVAMRTHLMLFSTEGEVLPYREWNREQSEVQEDPRRDLFPTGFGGVLYPPHSLSPHVFDEDAIRSTCIKADDLWLKIMSALVGTTVVTPHPLLTPEYVPDTQDVALCLDNLDKDENDQQLQAILSYVDTFTQSRSLIDWLRE